MFYTSKIPIFFINFSREKRSNRDIFVQKLRIEDVLLTYFEQYVSFLCNNQLKYTERMIFALNPWQFYPSQNKIPRALLLVNDSTSGKFFDAVSLIFFAFRMEDKPEKGIAIPLQVLKMFKDIQEVLPFEITNYPARALRALGLLLEDGAPTVWRGKTFWRVNQNFFTKTAVTPEQKVEKLIPRLEINRHAEG